MSRNQADKERHDERPTGFATTPCCAWGGDMSGSSDTMKTMMQASPCAGWMRRHRLAVYTAVTVAALGFLLLQAGWVLGIIAFFRTI